MASESGDPESVFDVPGSQPGLRKRLKKEAGRISSQHRQLDVFFEMVMSALGRSSLHGARVAYLRFRDALEAHITLEDKVFFPALSGLDPTLRHELTDLVHEHKDLRATLDELHDRLAKGDGARFQEGFERLAERFRDHEQREERILARTSG